MLVFLDIDGVMVPAKSWDRPLLLDDGFPAFSHEAVKALQKLISDGATIMLTTSHKSKFSIVEWKRIFENRGIHISSIDRLPENTKNLSRKAEILNWLSVNPSNESFLILDDDSSLNDLPGSIKEHFVQTSSYIGLTEDLIGRFVEEG